MVGLDCEDRIAYPIAMALLEEWVLPAAVTPDLKVRVTGTLRNFVDQRFNPSVVADGESFRVTVRVRSDNLIEFAQTLERPLSFFDGWDWEEEIDPLEDGDTYEFRVELVNKVPETFDWLDEKELPILSVYSKDGDNHAGWPAAFVLAARLAHEMGAVEPDHYPRQPN